MTGDGTDGIVKNVERACPVSDDDTDAATSLQNNFTIA